MDNKSVAVRPTRKKEEATNIGVDGKEAAQETLLLASNGVLDEVKRRENEAELEFDKAWAEL